MKTRHAAGWVAALGVLVLGLAMGSGSTAKAQGFFGVSTPGFSMAFGSPGYYARGLYPGAYYGAYPGIVAAPPVVVEPVIVPRPVVVPRPIYYGGYWGHRGGYGYGYGHGHGRHHGHNRDHHRRW